MVKANKHIEIVRSSTPGLSSMGEKSCLMIKGVLEQYYKRVEISSISDVADLDALVLKSPDLVFIGVKMVPLNAKKKSGQKVWVSEYLDSKGVAYTGSNAQAIALDFSKPLAKQTIKLAGLKTPAYFMAAQGQYPNEASLPLKFPLFIKPPCSGGGKGIGADSVVRDFPSFIKRVKYIEDNFKSEALVEEYLVGREFSVALIDSRDAVGLTAMPVELITEPNMNGDRVLGQGIKDADTEKVIRIESSVLRQLVADFATKAFSALGARDYGRIDVRLDKKAVPYFIEANLIPGVANHDFTSYFTRACWINGGMGYNEMIRRIVELGLTRSQVEQRRLATSLTDRLIVSPPFATPLTSATV